jgi:nitrogen fixation protein FixH
MELTSAELSNKMDEVEKELSIGLQAHQEVEQAILRLQRDILEKQTQKKDLEIALSKASHNNKQLTITLKLLTNQFWAAKHAGL